ncbi:MAG: type II toxin-antitoxin system RelE/ParE family toxin [bacterium]|nr:type II toxin-antitoxin system RelE/ParE family toxin [bacterium]
MDYSFTPSALKDLHHVDKSQQKRIIEKIKFYLSSPDPLSFAKTLTKSPYGTYRFRVLGKIRVIFIYEQGANSIVITRIRFRKEAY